MTISDPIDKGQQWAAARTKKRAPIPADQLREYMLQTAVSILTKTGGLTVSLAHLNMEELIRIADVPRSSVYREWKTKEAFYVDLMEKMVEPTEEQGAAWDRATLDVAFDVVERYKDRLETEAGKKSVLVEAVRQAAYQNFKAVSESLSWRTSTALAASLPALEEADRQRLLNALRSAESRFIERMSEFYEEVMPIFGLRMKEPYDTPTFAALASSIIEGLVGRRLTNPELVDRPILLPGVDGEPVEWHLSSVGFLAVLNLIVEPIPAIDSVEDTQAI
ncbi:hypothetical protein ACXYX3_27650 (plasmid) [Mycobacterium sp. C3-094]